MCDNSCKRELTWKRVPLGPQMYPLFLWAPSPKHLLLPGAGARLLGKVAAAGPEGEWPTLLPSTGNLT